MTQLSLTDEQMPIITGPDRFESWWAIWPRKRCKQAALRAFDKHIGTNPAKYVALMKNTRAWQRLYIREARPEHKIPYPATFLNRSDWRESPEVCIETKTAVEKFVEGLE